MKRNRFDERPWEEMLSNWISAQPLPSHITLEVEYDTVGRGEHKPQITLLCDGTVEPIHDILPSTYSSYDNTPDLETHFVSAPPPAIEFSDWKDFIERPIHGVAYVVRGLVTTTGRQFTFKVTHKTEDGQ